MTNYPNKRLQTEFEPSNADGLYFDLTGASHLHYKQHCPAGFYIELGKITAVDVC